jgi:hypothetical protein
LGPPPCKPGWPASPCTCNDLWLLSCMASKYIVSPWHFPPIVFTSHGYINLLHKIFLCFSFCPQMSNRRETIFWRQNVHVFLLPPFLYLLFNFRLTSEYWKRVSFSFIICFRECDWTRAQVFAKIVNASLTLLSTSLAASRHGRPSPVHVVRLRLQELLP